MAPTSSMPWRKARPGSAWCESVRYDLSGTLRHGVSAKDLFLHIARVYGDHANQNVEFGGPALLELSIDARRTLATMGTELNADFTIFEPDEAMLAYVRERSSAPFEPQYPDADCLYADRRILDLDKIEPLVALAGKVINNAIPASAKFSSERIHQAFIGSCANGNFDDLKVAAEVVSGSKVAAGRSLSNYARLAGDLSPGTEGRADRDPDGCRRCCY